MPGSQLQRKDPVMSKHICGTSAVSAVYATMCTEQLIQTLQFRPLLNPQPRPDKAIGLPITTFILRTYVLFSLSFCFAFRCFVRGLLDNNAASLTLPIPRLVPHISTLLSTT